MTTERGSKRAAYVEKEHSHRRKHGIKLIRVDAIEASPSETSA